MENLAKNVTLLLEERGMNAHDLSRATGIPQPSIYRIMTGQTKNPSVPRLKVIACYFGVDYADLIEKDLSQVPYTPKTPSEDRFTVVKYYSAKGECGSGELNDYVEIKGGMAFEIGWLDNIGVKEDRAAIIRATGNSMSPTISDGDIVLIDTSKIDKEEGRVFAIHRSGNGLVIKRLKINENGNWYYHSDNIDQNRYSPMHPLEDDKIIGRVMWQAGSGGL
ncbi:MAG: helix-turn-helix transcriptional regulator [Neisseriaceae bacterium]|nr:helix-turn-helix transcriptional regulator [Neisseriaceae bacterium]